MGAIVNDGMGRKKKTLREATEWCTPQGAQLL